MNKHVSTAAAAIALVSAIGLAYAQTADNTTSQSLDPNAPAQVQQSDAKDAVAAGTTATPDWRTPDTANSQADMPAQQPADQPAATTATDTNATTTDNAPTPAPAATDSSMNNTTDNGSTAAAPSPDTTSNVITERAPQADRN